MEFPAAAREPMRRQWRARGTTHRHCSSGSGRVPSTVMTFLGAVFVIVNCLM